MLASHTGTSTEFKCVFLFRKIPESMSVSFENAYFTKKKKIFFFQLTKFFNLHSEMYCENQF